MQISIREQAAGIISCTASKIEKSQIIEPSLFRYFIKYQ